MRIDGKKCAVIRNVTVDGQETTIRLLPQEYIVEALKEACQTCLIRKHFLEKLQKANPEELMLQIQQKMNKLGGTCK